MLRRLILWLWGDRADEQCADWGRLALRWGEGNPQRYDECMLRSRWWNRELTEYPGVFEREADERARQRRQKLAKLHA